jgi:hypothetical protein
MGQLIIPTERKVEGPWLIDTASIESLDHTLTLIDQKLEDAFIKLVERTAEERLSEFQERDKDMDIEKAKEKIKNSHAFEGRKKLAIVSGKAGDKIKDDTLLLLLKDRKIENFEPIELYVLIVKGPCEFTLEISAKYFGELETRTKVSDDTIFSDINYELSKWIEKHKPSIAMQKWSNWFPWASVPGVCILIMMLSFLSKNRTDMYKSILKQQSHEILKDSLSNEELRRAIQILLEDSSGYVPEKFNPNLSPNTTLVTIWFILLIALIVLNIKPRTVIGMGKNKWKVAFYKKWAYFVLVFLPLSIIFPILRNRVF